MDELHMYEEIVRLKQEGAVAVLATVVETAGASPRRAGAKMLVYRDGTIFGSVGGGRVERETIATARSIMGSGATRLLTFTADPADSMACGGALMRLFLESINSAPSLIVAGSGHVAQAVARTAEAAGFAVSFFAPGADPADEIPVPANGGEHFVFIATSEHHQDFRAALAALATPARYIGVLGSRKKRQAMDAFLRGKGRVAEEIARIISPAGLDIGAETPEEIAISVVGQMIALRRGP